MPGFDDDDLDREDTKLPFIYEGTVVDRNDPDKLGRVKFMIPGLIEPSSPWAFPAGTLGGGAKDTGSFAIPADGAEVYVFFVAGDMEEPRYLAGHWGETDDGNEVPEEAQKDPPDNRVIATPGFRIEMDESDGEKKLKLTSKSSGDFIEIDAEEDTITVQASTSIIATVGDVSVFVSTDKIELGKEGSGDKVVLDSKLQEELSRIKDDIQTLADEFGNHTHPLPQFIAPLIPVSTAPVIPGGPPAPPSEKPIMPPTGASDPGDTASELVTIDK